MELSTSKIKKFQEGIFQTRKMKKNFYIFFKKVFLIFREMELSYLKIKKVLIFPEIEFSSPKNNKKLHCEKISYISRNGTFYPKAQKVLIFFLKKNFSIFQEGTCKARKSKVFYTSLKIFSRSSE